MDYFKQRAYEILLDDKEASLDQQASQLNLPNAYRNLKAALRKPTVVHASSEEKPGYLKMTFSMCRNAVNGERFLEIQKL